MEFLADFQISDEATKTSIREQVLVEDPMVRKTVEGELILITTFLRFLLTRLFL